MQDICSKIVHRNSESLERREEKMRVRNAVADDLSSIVGIYNSTIPHRTATADTRQISVADRESWFHERDFSRRPIWIADDSGEVSGWLALGDFNSRPAYHPTAEVAVYIAESHRGQGVGRLLVKEAVRRGPQFGIKTLIAGVFAHNAASLSLFESFGFEHWAHMPRVAELDGVERDLVYLGLRLAE